MNENSYLKDEQFWLNVRGTHNYVGLQVVQNATNLRHLFMADEENESV